MSYFLLITGILFLLFGGDLIVRSAVDLALRFKVSVLVIGMTVVSFATSAPELLVSLDAALKGFTDISFGNVIGSNIANIALILGITAMIFPLDVRQHTYRVDWWVMMFVTIILFLLLWFDAMLNFWEGLFLFLLLILYNAWQIRKSRRRDVPEDEVEKARLNNPWLTFLFLVLGVAGLKFGSDFLITGAVDLANQWGVSQRIIGISIVSIGTSLPELAASMVAAIKRKPDLSVGNLIGSNIFNILAVLGISSMIIDLPVQSASLMTFDFPWLFAISIILYIMMRITGPARIGRWEGALLFSIYAFYIFLVF